MLLQKYHKLIFILLLLIGSITAIDVYKSVVNDPSLETSVQGVQIDTSQVQNLVPSLEPASTPTPTNNLLSTKPQPTTQAKEYGGWYWQPELGHAQRWMGIDAQGKDVWNDSGDSMSTPPQSNHLSGNNGNSGNTSNTTHSQTPPSTSTSQQSTSTSSMGQSNPIPTPSSLGTTSTGMVSTQSSLGTVSSVQTCLFDNSSNLNIPKCP